MFSFEDVWIIRSYLIVRYTLAYIYMDEYKVEFLSLQTDKRIRFIYTDDLV